MALARLWAAERSVLLPAAVVADRIWLATVALTLTAFSYALEYFSGLRDEYGSFTAFRNDIRGLRRRGAFAEPSRSGGDLGRGPAVVGEHQPEAAIGEGGGDDVGGRRRGEEIAVIAGPCSVESRSQIIETAQAVKEAGACALRSRSIVF